MYGVWPWVMGFAAMSNPTKIKKKKHSNMKKYLLIKISKNNKKQFS